LHLYDYVASGNCYKARLLLARLGEPYERIAIDIFGGDTLTNEFTTINRARETRSSCSMTTPSSLSRTRFCGTWTEGTPLRRVPRLRGRGPVRGLRARPRVRIARDPRGTRGAVLRVERMADRSREKVVSRIESDHTVVLTLPSDAVDALRTADM
jgi:hypothetical protein